MVRNISLGDMVVPALKVDFLDRYSRLVHSTAINAPAQTLSAGKQAQFSQAIKDFPRESVSVRVTFQEMAAGEPVKIVARSGG